MYSFEKIFEDYVKEVSDKSLTGLEELEEDVEGVVKPKNISGYERYIKLLKTNQESLAGIVFECNLNIPNAEFQKQFEMNILKMHDNKVECDDYYDTEISKIESQILEEIKMHNTQLKEDFENGNEIYHSLEDKRVRLTDYSDTIFNLCNKYGITSGDVNIDNDTFTLQELDKLYDDYLLYMETVGKMQNPIKLLRESVEDEKLQAMALVIAIFIATTPMLSALSLGFYFYIIYSQVKAKDLIQKYTILMGIVFNVNPLAIIEGVEFDESQLLPEEVDLDSNEDISILVEEWSNKADEYEEQVQELEHQFDIEKAALMKQYTVYKNQLENVQDTFDSKKAELNKKLTDMITDAQASFEAERSKIRLLGTSINSVAVFDTEFALGCIHGYMEEKVDIGLSNIVIRKGDDNEKYVHFIQVLLANAICNVRAESLNIIVYDPNRMGQDLVSFYNSDIQELIRFDNGNLEEIIKKLSLIVSKNMKDMKGLTITDFNTKAIEVGRTPKDYNLLVCLSQSNKVEEDEALIEFMKYSAEFGVFVWVVTEKDIPGTFVFNEPFEGIDNPYIFDSIEFGTKIGNLLADTKKSQKSDALMWKPFITKLIPDDKVWAKFTDDEVDFLPGYEEGDPTLYRGYTVGNQGNIHTIIVGGTGAGKSVFINNNIANQTREYSPKDLELWLIDFKGTEFKFYLPNAQSPYMLPHIKACLCTSDGDYAGSVFHALRTEAERRYQFLKDVNFKNIKEYNQMLRASNRSEEIIPRILMWNDEFQVIFEKAETKIIEQIKGDITYISKVARAAGIHLIFCSQSMKGTVSPDILQQFTLRFALRCDKEVSMSVMDTPFAGEIKQKNGYLYCRSLDDPSLDAQKRYRTPFIPDKDLREHIKDMALRAEKLPNFKTRNVITYEEVTVHGIEELDTFYEENNNKIVKSKAGKDVNVIPDNGSIFIGMRMTYSPNLAPDNFILTTENNQHIFSAFMNNNDLINFFFTIKKNLDKYRVPGEVFYNTQVADYHYLCHLDEIVPANMQRISTDETKPSDLISFFEGVAAIRKETGNVEKPMYIILLGWDKAVGFGIDPDLSLSPKYSTLLKTCGVLNMHFIFIGQTVGQVPRSIVEACSYKLAGKCDEDSSNKLLGNAQASKNYDVKDGYVFINNKMVISRAKIYQTELTREIQSNEVLL